MNSNTAFLGSVAENPFWHKQFILRQLMTLGEPSRLGGGKPFVSHDTTSNCCLYVTTMKAMNFSNDNPSNLNDVFEDHYSLVVDLSSMPNFTDHCLYPEKFGEH